MTNSCRRHPDHGRTAAALAEVERGDDVDRPLPARPPARAAIGSAPASGDAVRLDPELERDLLLLRAAQEQVSVTELIRHALLIRQALRSHLRAG